MEYIAAYVLCTIGHDKAEEAKVKEILTAAGATVDEAKVAEVFKALEGKNVWEVIEEGKSQMGSMAVAAAPAASATSAEAPKEENTEEKKEEKKEEAEEDFGGFGDLF
ncbi:60S acidic ribosomal protein P2, putative [Entamoeba invadens IP1]|uniref:60S acidic ribosomal protein P2, putative n=1 Tax=Entamoeba invadens IP1 TaxID=370355 RepID=A0A0A1U0R6_ENTIV|nr:60S acidic ribosomal protein P2, putative [Entamoeba invadens IP1]ELP84473.1 60S acidic ribosomal protein P2, putative [Entamoeba invadens IP1]|eukprot:XP_004183819.1 60S acidic ribosomal protein P2, putative [Entamoeba invadens IP1]